ncbi:MAG: hypothetical protein BGO06_26265, partial [Shinella sp. 65-6]
MIVGGQNISVALAPLLISLNVSDKSGMSSDSASIEIDDTNGALLLPTVREPVTIKLGWEGEGIGTVFDGTVDEVRARGSRSGRTITVTARSIDTRSEVKRAQRRHFDDATIEEAMQAAGKTAGVEVTVDPAFASIKRPYMALDDESFLAFGERMAHELGGTFKVVGARAVLAKRNGGVNPAGQALPVVTAAWGQNLHSYDLTPSKGRAVEKETATRWYDPKAAEWKVQKAETGTEGGMTTKTGRYSEADQDGAKHKAAADAAESDRRSGGGSVTIEGNIGAQPEGECMVSGCRPGVDGTYRIDGVIPRCIDHDLCAHSRSPMDII